MKQIVIIADDLTGACDTGIKFKNHGWNVKVLVDPAGCAMPQDAAAPVISINTKTRSAPPDAAQRVTGDLLRSLEGRGSYYYYKKLDSVLRGNISSELEACFQVLRPDFALIAPAFPAMGRRLREGRLYIGNEQAPEPGADAAALLSAGSGRACGRISLDIVRAGWEAVAAEAERLRGLGHTLLLADGWCEADLRAAAQAALYFGPRCLPAGSAGLADHLAGLMAGERGDSSAGGNTPAVPEGRLMVVVGSRHPTTVEQVRRLRETLSLRTYLLPVEGLTQENLTQRVEALFQAPQPPEPEDLLLTTDRICGGSCDCRFLLRENAYNQAILDAVSAGAEALLEQFSIAGIIATGGDMSNGILERLALNQIDLLEEPIPGIVTGIASGAGGRRILLATKSGGFGDPDALVSLFRHMDRIRRASSQ